MAVAECRRLVAQPGGLTSGFSVHSVLCSVTDDRFSHSNTVLAHDRSTIKTTDGRTDGQDCQNCIAFSIAICMLTRNRKYETIAQL